MKAIVRYRYGSTDDLELRDVEMPLVGDDDVVVRGAEPPVSIRGCGTFWRGCRTRFAWRFRVAGAEETPCLARTWRGWCRPWARR
jgi:hypothetical protein